MKNQKRLPAIYERLFASIQARLLAVFLVITLLTVVIVIAFNQRLQVQLTTEADNALLTRADQIADRIDEFNRISQQVFQIAASLPGLVAFLQADDATRNDPIVRNDTRIILDSFDVQPWDEYYVLSQAILDSDGQNILDTASDNIGMDESQESYFRAALLGGSSTISSLHYRPERGGIYFYHAVPIREATAPKSVIGVLRIQIAVASIQNIVFNLTRRQDLNVSIFDENFVRVADPQHEDLLFRSITTYSPQQITTLRQQYALPLLSDNDISAPVPDLVNKLAFTIDRQVVSGTTIPDSDHEERIAIVRLKTVPWYLVVSRSAAQHYQPVQQQTAGILILSISLTIIALISSYFISQRITEPIRRLTATAEKVAEGNLSVRSSIQSDDEVGTLAKTFNLMTSELEQIHATLEERVERRTQELSEINEKLTHEITERKRYEQQALELALEHERARILSEFIQKASHEFKTPLSVINVNSHIVKRFLPNERQRYLNVVEEQGRYIEDLVNSMVFMSRLDSDLSTHSEHIQIDKFLRTVYAREADALKETNASVSLDLRADDTEIYANPEFLFTAIHNVLDNALKFSDDPIEILIKSRLENGTVSVIIEDNGIGIPEESQSRVFERFYRVNQAHTTRGFGLGLPIANRIIESINGTITLDSEIDKGTTVTINLPIVKRT